MLVLVALIGLKCFEQSIRLPTNVDSMKFAENILIGFGRGYYSKFSNFVVVGRKEMMHHPTRCIYDVMHQLMAKPFTNFQARSG